MKKIGIVCFVVMGMLHGNFILRRMNERGLINRICLSECAYKDHKNRQRQLQIVARIRQTYKELAIGRSELEYLFGKEAISNFLDTPDQEVLLIPAKIRRAYWKHYIASH